MRDEQGAASVTIQESGGPRASSARNVFTAHEFSVVGFTIPFWCAAAAARSAPTGPRSLRAIARAMDPAGSTFSAQGCEAGSLWTSNKSIAEGAFYDTVEGARKAETLILRAASWETNPTRMTRAHCLSLCTTGTRECAVTYDGKSPLWGYDAESYNTTKNKVVGGLTCEGPRKGSFGVGLDNWQVRDSSAICVVSAAEQDIAPGVTPVRSVIVEHIEIIAGSKANPPSIDELVSRACLIASRWGNAPITCDFFAGPEVRRVLEQRGWREVHGHYFPLPA